MIGILLSDNAYEQDIRELLMAFYPGEAFTHSEEEEIRLLVRGQARGTSFTLSVKEEGFFKEESIEVDYKDRPMAKSRIKRLLYGFLRDRNERDLPWGTLTGIRPTKIAMAQFSIGQSSGEIYRTMKETYLASDGKLALCIDVAKREQDLLSRRDYKSGYSLYVGIPFCPTTCLYCSFTSYPIGKWQGKTMVYVKALEQELIATARQMEGRTLHTVYFGGGTPTSLPAGDLDYLLGRVKEIFPWDQVEEFTVEAGRPDSITEEKFSVLRKHGVTRISINPQSMQQKTLDLIGRHHTVLMVKDSFRLARSMGFDNINMDLITGLPGESPEDVRQTLLQLEELKPDSVTVHSLAVKRAARLNLYRDQYEPTDSASMEIMMELVAGYAGAQGLLPYYLYRQKNMAGNFENVGYSAPGKECVYNVLIMEEQQTIVGCGAGTTTKVLFADENRIERTENVKDVGQYIERLGEMLLRKEKMLANLPMSDTMKDR